MIDFQYLHTGVYGLANARKAETMAGQLGAANAADDFFGEDQRDLPDEVFRGLEGEIKRVIAGEESFWWNVKKSGITPADLFMPFPTEDSKPDPAYWKGMPKRDKARLTHRIKTLYGFKTPKRFI